MQAKAETVLSRVRNAKPETVEVIDYPQELLERSKGPLHQSEVQLASLLVPSVSPGPPVPDVQGPLAAGRVTLDTLPPPDKTAVAT